MRVLCDLCQKRYTTKFNLGRNKLALCYVLNYNLHEVMIMETGKKAKQRFVAAMTDLMNVKPLDKITVTEIVEKSGMTRQTFYRCFKDKYDLVNWHFERLAEKSFLQMGVSLTLREGLEKKFQFIKEEQVFFAAAFQSEDYNCLVAYDYQCILRFYQNIIEKKTKKPLSADILFLLEMYCRGSIDMTAQWAKRNMDLPPVKMADLLIQALPLPLEELLLDLQPE